MWKKQSGTGTINKASMSNPLITCRQCDCKMSRMEWLTNTTCPQPNCKCPEVQKLVKATQVAIQNARDGVNVTPAAMSYVHRGPVPHGYKDGIDQYYIKVPDVKVITVTPTPMRKR